MLTEKEKYRYSRHLLLDKVGEQGQEKLKTAKVLVIGAGGLGCPILQYLSAAGVGIIGIVDFDTIDETNLQRQVLFTTKDIGKNKAEVAANRLKELNEYVQFNIYNERLTNKNAIELFSQYDIVVDGTDNFSTRYLVNDACIKTNRPLVYGAIYKFEGQVSVFNYKGGPSYRCLFPEPPEFGSVPNCSDVGVIGVLPGLIGTQQANEVIKIILQIGQPLSGKLVMFDALNASQFVVEIKRNEEQIKIAQELDFEKYDYDFFCGIKNNDEVEEINLQDLLKLLEKEEVQIIDVRDEWERPKLKLNNILNAPLDDLEDYIEMIDRNKKVVVVCQSGGRSMQAIKFLQDEYQFSNLINLKEGIKNYKG